MGDLNAHLGSRDLDTLCYPVTQPCNSRGRQWHSLTETHLLHNVSLSSLASGHSSTYSSGGHTSTIDYVLGNDDALRGVSSCVTLDDHPLNTSDHLAIFCTLDLTHIRHPVTSAFLSQPLDWHQARGSEALFNMLGPAMTLFALFWKRITLPSGRWRKIFELSARK